MKRHIFRVLLILMVAAIAPSGFSQVHVRGYIRKDGTYVSPHYRSAPDGLLFNNWSTKGNVNPYTGKEGTVTSPRIGGIAVYGGSGGIPNLVGGGYEIVPVADVPAPQPVPQVSAKKNAPFAKGSTMTQVMAALGTPDHVLECDSLNQTWWYYGSASVVFNQKRCVESWNEVDGKLGFEVPAIQRAASSIPPKVYSTTLPKLFAPTIPSARQTPAPAISVTERLEQLRQQRDEWLRANAQNANPPQTALMSEQASIGALSISRRTLTPNQAKEGPTEPTIEDVAANPSLARQGVPPLPQSQTLPRVFNPSLASQDVRAPIQPQPQPQVIPPRPVAHFRAGGSAEKHWIKQVLGDGAVIELEDGTMWEVSAVDRIDSALWLPTTDVILLDDEKIISVDDNESVEVNRVR